MKVNDIYPSNRQWSLNDIFNDVFGIFKGVFGYGVLTLLFFGLFFFACFIILYAVFPAEGMANFIEEYGKLIKNEGNNPEKFMKVVEQFSTSSGVKIYMLLFSIFSALGFPLVAGFVKVCREYDTEGKSKFSTLFSGFNSSVWARFFVLGFIFYLAINLIEIALSYSPAIGFLSTFFRIYWATVLVLACPFIWFKDLGTIEAIKNSIQMVHSNFWNFLAAVVVMGIVSYLGIILCGVGILFTYPIIYITAYSLYKHHIGFGETQETIEQIGTE